MSICYLLTCCLSFRILAFLCFFRSSWIGSIFFNGLIFLFAIGGKFVSSESVMVLFLFKISAKSKLVLVNWVRSTLLEFFFFILCFSYLFIFSYRSFIFIISFFSFISLFSFLFLISSISLISRSNS